jgi:hypothetical protein
MDRQKIKARVKIVRNSRIKFLVIQTTTLSHSGTVTKRDTHKLNAVQELEKINQ